MGSIRKFVQQGLVGMGWRSPEPEGEMTSPFDVIRREDMHGEYWLARELAPKLGYDGRDSWKNFSAVVDRARDTLRGVDREPGDHVAEVGKLIEAGKGARREIEDFRLSRLACYLVAMSGDSKKPEVAAAKTYFATKTREAELVHGNPKLDRKVKTWLSAGKDWDFIETKLKAEGVRSVWTDTHQEAGIKGWGHSHLTRMITKKLMGKYPKDIREERGVKKTRDGFTVPELVNMMFAESLSAQMAEKLGSQGYEQCKVNCEIAADNTVNAIQASLGSRSLSGPSS